MIKVLPTGETLATAIHTWPLSGRIVVPPRGFAVAVAAASSSSCRALSRIEAGAVTAVADRTQK